MERIDFQIKGKRYFIDKWLGNDGNLLCLHNLTDNTEFPFRVVMHWGTVFVHTNHFTLINENGDCVDLHCTYNSKAAKNIRAGFLINNFQEIVEWP